MLKTSGELILKIKDYQYTKIVVIGYETIIYG